jgi:hypothetical protein
MLTQTHFADLTVELLLDYGIIARQPRPQAPVRAWGLRRAAIKAHLRISHFPLFPPMRVSRVFLPRRALYLLYIIYSIYLYNSKLVD